MGTKNVIRQALLSNTAIIIGLAIVKLLLHFWSNSNYGVHRDELLYLAMGEHLDWGYLEVPPSIAVFARLSRSLLGDSLFAIRFFPALLGSLLVLFTGLVTRELGGKRFAMVLAMVAVVIAPVFLRTNTLFQPFAFDQFYWMACSYLLILIIKQEKHQPRLWVVIGVMAGLGLLNKYSMLLWGFGTLFGLVITSRRCLLRKKWPWLGAFLSLLIFLPNLIWQFDHNLPVLEHLRKLSQSQLGYISRVDFLLEQVLILHPATVLIWVAGLFYLLFAKATRPFRLFGWSYLAILAMILVFKGQPCYLVPAYPLLLAAGAIFFERLILSRNLYWLKSVILMALILQGIIIAPYGLPILPVKDLETYVQLMAKYAGLTGPLKAESGKLQKIPPDYAEMFGWEEKVTLIAKAYHMLTPGEQAQCVLLAGNYGQAGAIDFYGTAYELPKALSFHSSYYLWGPGRLPGNISLAIGFSEAELKQFYDSVEQVGFFEHDYVIDYENRLPVYRCEKPRVSLQEAWPEFDPFR